MKTKYLNYGQAWAVCHEYQTLRGHTGSGATPVEAVLLAPYSRILQWHYVRGLLKGEPATDLLKGYPGERYDVIVLTRNPETPGGFDIQALRDYLAMHQMDFDISRYAGLRRF